MHDTHFYPLVIKEVVRETPDAVSLYFNVPDELKEHFTYVHGQYLTLRFTLNGKEVRRAYSLCTSPVVDTAMAVTVKRVEKGLVSTHIHTNLKAGDTVEVMHPEGRFTIPLNFDNKKDYFLIGAGSGITPLMSIAKSILETEPKSRVFLMYGNRKEEDIIYREALATLEQRYSGQFKVHHTLSQPKTEKAGGLGGLFKKPKVLWDGGVGRIDAKSTALFIDENVYGDNRETEFFLCGPSGMLDSLHKMLKARGINDKHVHIEWFTTADQGAKKADAGAGTGGAVKATLNGKVYEVEVASNETILDALRRVGQDPPYSCLSGACATCMAKVTKGTLKMDACFALDDDEVANGYCLACQAHPTSEDLEITFDI